MHHRLGNAEIARRDALVEATKAVLLVDPLNTLTDGHFVARVVVELEASLHKPDGVCCSRRDEASAGCARDV